MKKAKSGSSVIIESGKCVSKDIKRGNTEIKAEAEGKKPR